MNTILTYKGQTASITSVTSPSKGTYAYYTLPTDSAIHLAASVPAAKAQALKILLRKASK